jgi:ATP-dependent helicase HepA
LADRGARRLGVRPGADAAATLGAVSDHLERRLENVTIEAARRVGIVPDVEVDVLPGEVGFHVGPELKIDALAGFDLSQDRTVLGSFRRAVAVAHEEHDSFATGHPLVEALFGFVRDGELGRTTVVRTPGRGKRGVAIDARYLVVLPEPADLAQGARVPSRRAARHLEDALVRVVVRIDARGEMSVDEELAAMVDPGRSEGVPAPEGGPPPAFVAAIERGLGRAEAEAAKRLRRLVTDAKERLEREKEAGEKRLARWLAQSGTKAKERERILAEEAALHEAAKTALDGARLELDQAAVAQLV